MPKLSKCLGGPDNGGNPCILGCEQIEFLISLLSKRYAGDNFGIPP